MSITLVVCMAKNRIIGRAGGMPWRMPSDLKHFRALTMGKPVIMGRKTFESVGKPLDGRTNYVVSRQRGLAFPGATAVASLEAALATESVKQTADVMVIGGGQIYAQALVLANRVIATELQAEIDGDTTFPPLDPAVWRVASRTPLATGPKDDYPADVVMYERIE